VDVAAPGFVPPDLAMSGLVLSPFPASYRPGAAQRFRVHDAALSAGDAIYFTLGTVFNLESGDLFTRVLAGLRDRDVVARVLDPLGATPADIRAALADLDGCRPAAARLHEEIAGLPGPEEAVAWLEVSSR
jgi:hypothetical protein